MKKTALLKTLFVIMAGSLIQPLGLFAQAPDDPQLQVVETTLNGQTAVQSAVQAYFSEPLDSTGIRSGTLSNPAAATELRLGSYGTNVELELTLFARSDADIPSDSDIWQSDTVEPQYVEGTPEVFVDSAGETALETLLSGTELFHETYYAVNYTTTGEIAAYDKLFRIVFKKADEPAGSLLVMNILNNILSFDWSQPTKASHVEIVPE